MAVKIPGSTARSLPGGQKDGWEFSQAHAFGCMREVYQQSVRQRSTALTGRIIQFADWIIEQGRDDTKSILAACFVEHLYDGLDREDVKYLKPLLDNSRLLAFSRTIPLCRDPET